MILKNTLPITEARRKIFQITDDVQKGSNYYTLTDRGRPKAVVLSADEFDSWKETMEVMREFPDLDKDIKETDLAVKKGEYRNWTTLEELLAREGFLIADKSIQKYGVPIKDKAKSRKRVKKNS